MQKIEQFKITAHELADAASQTESFVNSPESIFIRNTQKISGGH